MRAASDSVCYEGAFPEILCKGETDANSIQRPAELCSGDGARGDLTAADTDYHCHSQKNRKYL